MTLLVKQAVFNQNALFDRKKKRVVHETLGLQELYISSHDKSQSVSLLLSKLNKFGELFDDFVVVLILKSTRCAYVSVYFAGNFTTFEIENTTEVLAVLQLQGVLH